MPITAQPAVVVIAGRTSDIYLGGLLFTGQDSRVFAGSGRTMLIRSVGAGDEAYDTGHDASGCDLAGDVAEVIAPRGEPFDLVDVLTFATASERDTWIQESRDADAIDRAAVKHTALQERSSF